MPRTPIEFALRNLFWLRRAENALAREADEMAAALVEEIVAELVRIDPTAVSAATYQRGRVDKLMERVGELSAEGFTELHKVVRRHLANIGREQSNRTAEHLREMLAGASVRFDPRGPGVNAMKAILDADPFEGQTLRQWADTQDAATVRRVRRQVQLGMAQGEGIGDIVDRVRGRRAGRGFAGGILSATRRDTEALVRTAVNFVASEAQFRTYAGNERITEEYQYTATLDARTTVECAGLDGQTFRYDDETAPRPPRHFRCRSQIVPVILWENIGLTPPDEGTRASRTYGVDDGEAKVTGGAQVSASLDYEGWLRRQPKAVQVEVLGRSRADLFRDRKMGLREMIRTDGRLIRLDELSAN